MMINDMKSKVIVKNIHKMKSFVRTRRLLALTLTAMLFAVACGGGAELTMEQLKELEETKTAALSAEEKVEKRKADQKTLSENLTAKKKELNQLLTDKDILKKRLKDIENPIENETEADINGIDTKSEDNGDGR